MFVCSHSNENDRRLLLRLELLTMLHNVVLNIKAIDQILVSDHSNENEYFQAELFIMLYTVVAAF